MVLVHPLVAEVLADFVNPFESARDQALEVKLIGDPEVKGLVERIVMSREGTRSSAPVQRLEHWRLDFEITVTVQILPKGGHELGANFENPPNLAIGNQIRIALAIALLDILQAMIFVRWRIERLGQHSHHVAAHRNLAGLGAEQRSRSFDPITQIEKMEEIGKGLVAQLILAEIELDRAVPVADLDKDRFAHMPDGSNSPTNRH